jgi:hypothetical protein
VLCCSWLHCSHTLIVVIDTSEMSGQPYVSVTLPPGKAPSPHYPLNRGLGGLQSHLALMEERDALPLLGIERQIAQSLASHCTG